MKYSDRLTGHFNRWLVDPDSGVLIDDAGNEYGITEIRSIFFNRQLITSLVGNSYDPKVVSLVRHLEKKIEATKLPVVTVSWGDGHQEKLSHPYG